jgi:hypothetical protein
MEKDEIYNKSSGITDRQVISLFNKMDNFKDECELQLFILNNLKAITSDILKDDLVSYEKESYIHPLNRFSKYLCPE